MKITVEKVKYDGRLMWVGQGELVSAEDGRYTVHFLRHTLTTYKGEPHILRAELVHVYWTDRWYNIWAANRNPGRQLYCNIAMPMIVENDILRFVDLDIDVARFSDGTIEVYDDDEFEEHRQTMGYSDEIVAHALAAREEVIRLCQKPTGAFDWQTLPFQQLTE